jgi:hypothetical protein
MALSVWSGRTNVACWKMDFTPECLCKGMTMISLERSLRSPMYSPRMLDWKCPNLMSLHSIADQILKFKILKT